MNLRPRLSQMSLCHSNHADLTHLNPGKIYKPNLASGEEYGNTAPQRHCQQLGHKEAQQQDLLPALPFCTKFEVNVMRKYF